MGRFAGRHFNISTATTLILSLSLIALSCETIEETENTLDRGETTKAIRQLHGRTSDLTEDYLSRFPALSDYDSEPDKIIADIVTSEARDIDYSEMYLRSFASPSLFFADITDCEEDALSDTYIYKLDIDEDPECYRISECSGVMISPNILMTAGHCPCLGFGFAAHEGLSIDERDSRRVARVLFRSYINNEKRLYSTVDRSDPANYVDEYFDCVPIFEGWTEFDPDASPITCENKPIDLSYFWCYDDGGGEAPGDKYGFVDYEVDHFQNLVLDRRRIITQGYPRADGWMDPPPDPDELFYSIWQNPFYVDNYWNKENPDYVNDWNRDNAWPLCNYIHRPHLCNASWDPFNIFSPSHSADLKEHDYYLFYGHKLISEGTHYAGTTLEDTYLTYKTHGGSGSPMFGRGGKLVSGPTLSVPHVTLRDHPNAGMENRDPPSTRLVHDSLQKILFHSRLSSDEDQNFLIDLVEEPLDAIIAGAVTPNTHLAARDTYFLPLHDWHVRRGVWNTDNRGSLFWDGAYRPREFLWPTDSIAKVPFGVVSSRKFGSIRFVGDGSGGFRLEYIPPDDEVNLYTESDAVPLEPETEYGVVVKYIDTYNPFTILTSSIGTYVGIGAERHKLFFNGLTTPTYDTVYVTTGHTADNSLEVVRRGLGQTMVENISIQKLPMVFDDVTGVAGKVMSFTFDNWDEREIWRTFDDKHTMFWNVSRQHGLSWAAVLLAAYNPTNTKNLTTYYLPFRDGRDYQICMELTSNRDGPIDTQSNDISVVVELRDANDTSRIISSDIIDESEVGYLDNNWFIWTHNCVELSTSNASAQSYMLIVRRGRFALPEVLIDSLEIVEL